MKRKIKFAGFQTIQGFFFFQQVNLKIITWEHHLFESISNQVPIQKFLTKMIREKNTPKKVKILIWSVAYGSLNMMDESKDSRSWLSLQHSLKNSEAPTTFSFTVNLPRRFGCCSLSILIRLGDLQKVLKMEDKGFVEQR